MYGQSKVILKLSNIVWKGGMTKQPEAPRESILAHNNMGLSIEKEKKKMLIL